MGGKNMRKNLKKYYHYIALGFLAVSLGYVVYAPLVFTNVLPRDYESPLAKFSWTIDTFYRDGYGKSRQISSWNGSELSLHNYLLDAEIWGNYLFVAAGPYGLLTFDISNIYNPTLLNTTDFTEGIWGLKLIDQYLYATTEDDGLAILDISDPLTPSTIGNYTNGLTSWNLNASTHNLLRRRNFIIHNDIAFLCNKNKGVSLLNVSDLSNPTLLSYAFNGTGISNDVYLVNDVLYVADQEDGLEIYNVSDPVNPIMKSTFKHGNYGKALGISITEHYAYLADEDDGLEILNLSNPISPQLESTFGLISWNRGSRIEIHGDLAYYTENYGHVYICSLEEPGDPKRIGEIEDKIIYSDTSFGYPFINEFCILNETIAITLDSTAMIIVWDLGRDADEDLMPDYWEFEQAIADPNADPDFDGITNVEEYFLETNPRESRFSLAFYIGFLTGATVFIGSTVVFLIGWIKYKKLT